MRHVKPFLALSLLVALLAGAAGADAPALRMATTTSTDNTGLLDYLQPILLQDAGIDIQWVSVGTGKALEYGRNGDVDVVLTHDPDAEKAFIDEAWGVEPRQVMYNDFVLLGPARQGGLVHPDGPGDAGHPQRGRGAQGLRAGRPGYLHRLRGETAGRSARGDRGGGGRVAQKPVQRHPGEPGEAQGRPVRPGEAIRRVADVPQGAAGHREFQAGGQAALFPQREVRRTGPELRFRGFCAGVQPDFFHE